ncbi:MAG: patatin-like phospholipase family protein [Candidatus Marinimicrobia bacterium]|nr:patatin-like phospholipase family protein [Candidatus Neomarinimicrobiota bacterium]
MENPRIALVLGSGAARGLAHIGVIKVLEKNKIPIHIVVGTSMGAFVGGYYSAGFSAELMGEIALQVDKRFVVKTFTPGLQKSGFVNIDRVRDFISNHLNEKEIEQLPISYSAVATDLSDGTEIVLNSGKLVDAILSSIAIPILFTPVKYRERLLVDGGLVNPLPVSVAYENNADIIIAVNAIPNPEKYWKLKNHDRQNILNKFLSVSKEQFLKQLNFFNDKEEGETINLKNERSRKIYKQPNLLKILLQTIIIFETQLQALQLLLWKPDILISPSVEEYSLLEFYRAKDIIKAGEESAIKALTEIERLYS